MTDLEVSRPLTAVASASTSSAAASLTLSSLKLPSNFPVALNADQQSQVLSRIQAFDLQALAMLDIASLGLDAERELGRALDKMLSSIDKRSAPKVFALMESLNTSIEAENLNEVADRVMNPRPSLGSRFLGKFSSSAMRNALNKVLEETSLLVSTKSKKLSEVVAGLETQMVSEMRSVEADMRSIDQIMVEYRRGLDLLAVEVLFLVNVAELAVRQVTEMDQADSLRVIQAQQKAQALQSRALAVEGAMTRLPASQLQLAMIQDAGMSTLLELATTLTSRFGSIKDNLIQLHLAVKVMGLQQLGAQGRHLDENLTRLNNRLTKEITLAAANAPGDNRVAQAQQITSIIDNTRELVDLTAQARVANDQKFKQTQEMLSVARQSMLDLGKAVMAGRTS